MAITIESGPTSGSTRVDGEAGLLHPGRAVRAGVVESARRLDQHVQAHHQPERVLRSVVVDDRLVDDQGAARGHGVEGLPDQHLLRRQIPVVQDVAHQDHIGLWQRFLEEVSGHELDAILDADRGEVLLAYWPDLRAGRSRSPPDADWRARSAPRDRLAPCRRQRRSCSRPTETCARSSCSRRD